LLITAELSNVTAPETFPVPSKAPVVNVASPVPEIVLPAAKAVAVEAFPVKAPKDVEVIDTIPAIVLTVERAAIAVV
jgi:hypothetical protein